MCILAWDGVWECGNATWLLWEYTSTDCTEHGSVCKSCYSENSLELSILVKIFAFGHNTVIYSCVCSLLVYTHEGKLLSILLSLFPLSSPLSVELVVAGSGTQELAVFSCVPRDLGLCCSVSLQWARVEQVGPSTLILNQWEDNHSLLVLCDMTLMQLFMSRKFMITQTVTALPDDYI